jgi:hypothetical protein
MFVYLRGSERQLSVPLRVREDSRMFDMLAKATLGHG